VEFCPTNGRGRGKTRRAKSDSFSWDTPPGPAGKDEAGKGNQPVDRDNGLGQKKDVKRGALIPKGIWRGGAPPPFLVRGNRLLQTKGRGERKKNREAATARTFYGAKPRPGRGKEKRGTGGRIEREMDITITPETSRGSHKGED